ncbi:glycosyltransferase [bacterium]|nr:glycosyltransferase [bacterium]
MSRYLLIHRDQPIRPLEVNAGAEMATLHLARFLAKGGDEVVVAGQIGVSDLQHEGVEFWDIGEEYDCRMAIDRMSERGAYHLLSAGRVHPFLLVQDDPHCLTRLLISHDRAVTDTGMNPKPLLHYVDRIITVSDAQRLLFLDAQVDPARVKTIRNGVDHELFPAYGPDERDWNKIVFVGALVQDKGLDLLLIAFTELKAQFPELTLDVYGSAELWDREPIYDTERLQADIPGLTFYGSRPQAEVARAFQTAGMCVVPSIWFDPFPLVAIEAQVSGCPVVTFDVGGLGEGVRHGETGLVLPEVGEEELQRALRELLSDPNQLRSFSHRALELQRKTFSWENVVSEIKDVQREVERERRSSERSTPLRIGVMSTWNQQCGLATFTEELFSQLSESYPNSEIRVFSEYDTGEFAAQNILDDEKSVFPVSRCWSWKEKRWSNLLAALQQESIDVLYVNAHNPKQLSDANFSEVISYLKQRDIRIVLQLHTVFTLRVDAREILQQCDEIVIPLEEMKIEVSSYGIESERIRVIPHGIKNVPSLSDEERGEVHSQLGLPQELPIISSSGYIHPHKGLREVLEAVKVLKDDGLRVHACIAGKVSSEDKEAQEYAKKLRRLVLCLHIEDQVTFIDRFLSDKELLGLQQISDVVVLNYSSDHYECSGACSRALGTGANVITSMAPAFTGFGTSVWHTNPGFSIPLAIRELLTNEQVKQNIAEARKSYCQDNSWKSVVPSYYEALMSLRAQDRSLQTESHPLDTDFTTTKEHAVSSSQHQKDRSGSGLRILIQNRKNMYTQRGGDTIVVDRLLEGLQKRGVDVHLDLEGTADLSQFDLLHIINFALPQMVEYYGRRAEAAGIPFVVTTLCEDVPRFHHQSQYLAELLTQYVREGQDRTWLEQQLGEHRKVSPSEAFPNGWSAAHAAALLVNGEGEKKVIERTYPGHAPISIVPVGHEVSDRADPQLFREAYGVEDFIFCVGRFESRKNQLMLQSALEDVDLPVVYASGGFSYQPEYAEAVRTFQRKGKTIVLDRVEPEMLASAYAAAKVHALPSWYELPGLVSLEGGILGCNVVAVDSGTTKDYLGEYGFYCEPDNISSIRNAVLAAYYAPYRSEFASHLQQFTWDSAAESTLAVYRDVLGVSPEIEVPASSELSHEPFEELAKKGYEAAQRKELEEAHRYLAAAEESNPRAIRVLCNRAAVFLAEERVEKAKEYFQRARNVDPSDNKAHTGYAMCLMMEEKKELAHGEFLQILERDPTDMIAILQLLDCSYSLERYEALEEVLKKVITLQPENFDMRFCLAGCLVRENKLEEARSHLEVLLAERPQHGGSLELQEAIRQLQEKAASSPAPQEDSYSKQDGAIDGALARFVEEGEKSTEVNGNPPRVRDAVETTQVPVPSQPFDSIDFRIGELEELKHRKDLDEALEGADQLLARAELSERQRTSVELLRGEVQALLGNRDEAKEIFHAHHAHNPKCPRALCGLAAIAASYNELDESRKLFEEALRHAPEYDKALAGLGFCDLFSKQYPTAWGHYNAALDSNPENLSALFGCIQLSYILERLPDLQRRLETYLDMHPADLDMVYAYAGCLYAQRSLDEALSEVQKILIFKPEDSRAQELKGMIEEQFQQGSLTAS